MIGKKSIISIGYALVVLFALPACKSSTCEKAVDRTISCVHSDLIRETLMTHRDRAVAVCRPYSDAADKCLSENSCGAFLSCMEKATGRLRMKVGPAAGKYGNLKTSSKKSDSAGKVTSDSTGSPKNTPTPVR